MKTVAVRDGLHRRVANLQVLRGRVVPDAGHGPRQPGRRTDGGEERQEVEGLREQLHVGARVRRPDHGCEPGRRRDWPEPRPVELRDISSRFKRTLPGTAMF